MKLYLIGFPSTSLNFVEAVLKFSTNIGIDYGDQQYIDAFKTSNRGVLRSTQSPQFSCVNTNQIKQSLYDVGDPSIVQVISPLNDGEITDIWDHIHKQTCIYVSPEDPVFNIVNHVTLKNSATIFSPTDDIKRFNPKAEKFSDLERWQRREYLSQFMDYFFVKTKQQKTFADAKNIKSFATEGLFYNPQETLREIISYLGLEIVHDLAFTNLCTLWELQNPGILNDYGSVSMYINAINQNNQDPDLKINLRSVVYEAIIQRHLAKNNKELRCYNLNNFPKTVRELSKYYEELEPNV